MGRVPAGLRLADVGDGRLAVSEVFGPTIQGEGPTAGRRAAFVRLAHCNLDCAWCFVPETLVLCPDWRWRAIGSIAAGDAVMARTLPADARHGVLSIAEVTHIARRVAPLVRVNGELTCTPDHPFWVARNRHARSGWRPVERCAGLKVAFVAAPPAKLGPQYERGWVAGMAVGDGCFWTLSKGPGRYRRFRLALNDTELLDRFRLFAAGRGFALRPGVHRHVGSADRASMPCLWLTVDEQARRLEQEVLEDVDDAEWAWGFLGGMLDAEGSLSANVLRVAQSSSANLQTVRRLSGVLDRLGLRHTVAPNAVYVSRAGGAAWRVLSHAAPLKDSLLAGALGHAPNHSRLISSVESAGAGEVVSLTTTLGSYVAGGYVVKNCDTAYTWDWARHDPRAEIHMLGIDEALVRLDAMDVDRVVVTGGEPLLQQARLGPLLDHGWAVEVETNGTIAPTIAVDQFNVSPKLANSGIAEGRRIKPAALAALMATGKAVFKFVATSPADLDEIAAIVDAHGLAPVWVMPEGTTADAIVAGLRALADPVAARGWNLSPRLHVLAWGDQRGH